MTTLDPSPTAPLGRVLQRLYFLRFGVAIVWALLLVLIAPMSSVLLTVLLVLYPLIDAASVATELRANRSSARSKPSELANVVVSILAAIALGIASLTSVSAALAVWGVWAVLAGVAQLLTGLSRRRMGGQWPQVFSGGLSVLVGFAFLGQGLQGSSSVASLAGYASFGGILFLVSAIRLAVAARKA